jgi:hypothetical protein
LASDADACAEAQEMAADFLLAENEALAGAEAPANATSAEPWWRSRFGGAGRRSSKTEADYLRELSRSDHNS